MQKLLLGLHIPVLVLVALVYGWIIVSYGVMFWHTRRSYPLHKMLIWTMYSIIAWLQIQHVISINGLARYIAERDWGLVLLHSISFAIYIGWPMLSLYRRWVDRIKEPGYAHARDFLLLRRPALTDHPDPAEGAKVDFWGFVRTLPGIVLLASGITLVFFGLTKLIFGFGPFF
jgi:hypothetical protein